MIDVSFRHLQLEFARLDIMLHRQIQRLQQNGAATTGLNSYHLSEEQAYALLQRPFGHSLHLTDDETNDSYSQALAQTEEKIASLVTQAEQEGQPLRLFQLATLLGLDRFVVPARLQRQSPGPTRTREEGRRRDDTLGIHSERGFLLRARVHHA